jgi:hypothetical protein
VNNYLDEQLDANFELSTLLTRIQRATLHMHGNGTKEATCDGFGLYAIDKELEAKYSK